MSASDAVETNENYQISNQLGLDLQNQNKTTRNFLRQTISTASKAVVLRRNVLAEMNESSELILSETHVKKTPIFDRKQSSGLSRFREDEPKSLVSDSSSKPYDPLTNYLSPRPKFLRYNPNRCREIFQPLENESNETEDEDGSSDAVESASFDSNYTMVKEKDVEKEEEEIDESENGYDNIVKEIGSVGEEDEEIDESEDEYDDIEEEIKGWNMNSVLNNLLVFTVVVISTLYITSMNSPTTLSFSQTIRNATDEFQKIQSPLFGSISLNNFEDGNVELLDMYEESEFGQIELDEGQNFVVTHEFKDDMIEPNVGESSVVKMIGSENNETVRMDEVSKVHDVLWEDDKVETNVEVSYLLGKIEDVQDFQPPIIPDCSYHQGTVSDLITASESEGNSDRHFKGEIENIQVMAEEVGENESERLVDSLNNEESNLKLVHHDQIVNWIKGVIGKIKTGSKGSLAIGMSTILAIVSSLLLWFHFKRKTTSDKGPSSPVNKPDSDPKIIDNETMEQIEKPYFHMTSLNRLMEEPSEEIYQSRAPRVELLGEFEVEEFSASSLKSCRKKSRMVEADLSNYSISHEETSSWSKGKTVPVSELSYMDSTSFGSFTAEKKIIKKEEGRDGEVRKEVITTPVRRSSRIHKRTVASPF